MLGIMMKISGIHLTLITAAQWKNAFNKIQDLKELYKEMKSSCRMEPHPIDAVCMSLYSAGMYFELNHSPFKVLESSKRFAEFKISLKETNKDAKHGTGKRQARTRKKK
jgi:hypothetical protein